jgi:hypothetical protein
MCGGCREAEMNPNLTRETITALKGGFHSLTKVSNISDSGPMGAVEAGKGYGDSGSGEAGKAYDGQNYFDRQRKMGTNSKSGNSYSEQPEASYSQAT